VIGWPGATACLGLWNPDSATHWTPPTSTEGWIVGRSRSSLNAQPVGTPNTMPWAWSQPGHQKWTLRPGSVPLPAYAARTVTAD
jgi:hypothetical protein